MLVRRYGFFFHLLVKRATRTRTYNIARRNFRSSLGLKKNDLVFPSMYSDVTIPEGVTLTQYLFDKQEEFGDAVAAVNGETGESLTHVEMRSLSLRLGSALWRLGLSTSDMVAIVSPNCPEFMISFVALSVIGAIPSTISFSFNADEIRYQLLNADCVAVICHEEKVRDVLEACQGNTKIRHIISTGPEKNGVLSLRKLLKDDGTGLPSHVNVNPSEDLAVLPYSSGTTGLPKGVMITHANLVANIQQMSHPSINILDTVNTQSVIIGVLPMYHIYGMMVNICLSYTLGAQIITLKEFNKHTYSNALKKYKPTVLPVVPPLLSFLESSSLVTPQDLASVSAIVCGAAPLGEALYNKFRAKFGHATHFYEGYGMTELSPLSHSTPRGGYVVGSCGMSVPNTLVKIVDPISGKCLGLDEGEGELCIKGPQVMKGYFKNEKATQETIRDGGWLHTGDIARLDKNQHLYVVDRLKELIKVKGLQVAPAELEDLLRQHPGVSDVAVIGVPDEKAGEVPKAFVVPVEGGGPRVTEEDVKKFVAERVSSYKHIHLVEFVDEIPKSASGKILRKDLRSR